MVGMSFQLKEFDKHQTEIIRPWFDDVPTKKWLGDRTWVDNITRLQNESVGSVYRGQRKLNYFAFVAYDDNEPVGFIDGGITDRWVKYGGEKDGTPIYLEIIEKPTSGISFVTNPTMRNRGYATIMIKALVRRPEYESVKIFEAVVEPENTGSIKTLESAGFSSDYKPDFEGMIYFFLKR
jgi:RimJ/RimL family protein N-acetyltransferase